MDRPLLRVSERRPARLSRRWLPPLVLVLVLVPVPEECYSAVSWIAWRKTRERCA
ncbi:hypothetical protein Pen02_00060 [Plantactinospora endophytica]|uniref:Uncharacterized protein n=1 Tax=Plantactinospora endophytica TaxID=673535 RepID=A0ABQ4DRI4_9ACTN|nr:hypothetical protein Pen02_00060 [Plantactinospora endophytica]